nr:MAG TPA: hypothetical protein [Caudoviricetes sp.]
MKTTGTTSLRHIRSSQGSRCLSSTSNNIPGRVRP